MQFSDNLQISKTKSPVNHQIYKALKIIMRKMGLEPTRAQCSQDPQSCSSASSDTSAYRISSGFFILSLATSDSIAKCFLYVNTFFQKFCIFLFFLLFCHFYLWPCSFCFQEFFVCSYFGCRHFERTVGMFSILYFLLKEKAPTSVTDSHTPHTKKNPACKGYPVTESTVLTNSNHPNGRSDSKKTAFFFLLSIEKRYLWHTILCKRRNPAVIPDKERLYSFFIALSRCALLLFHLVRDLRICLHRQKNS